MSQALARSSSLRIVPLSRDTLQERVYRQVSDLILDGEIAPGQQVTIQGLAEAFGVSTMPVREALKRLTAAKALTFVSGRSMGIPRLGLERLTDLRDVRLELEGLAAERAAGRIDAAGLAAVREAFERMEVAIAAGDVKSYLRGNRAFHFAVYAASRSPTLVELIENLWLQVSPYFNLLHGSGNYVAANVQHGAALEALGRGDGVATRRAIAADIEGAFSVLRTLMP